MTRPGRDPGLIVGPPRGYFAAFLRRLVTCLVTRVAGSVFFAVERFARFGVTFFSATCLHLPPRAPASEALTPQDPGAMIHLQHPSDVCRPSLEPG